MARLIQPLTYDGTFSYSRFFFFAIVNNAAIKFLHIYLHYLYRYNKTMHLKSWNCWVKRYMHLKF